MWAFEVTPHDLPVIYWSHSLQEIKDYMRLKLNWWQVQALQQHQLMSIIIRQAFGSGDETDETPQTFADAQRQLATVFNPR